MKAKRRAEQFLLTRDKSWFFCDIGHSRIWLSPDADRPEVARRRMSDQHSNFIAKRSLSLRHISEKVNVHANTLQS
jgi:hypothetical protein